ncbi:aspartate carbamoyltransferase regulatory subunit [Candidatus Woesearchaeota archaeon]|nr:aspartate carbamoyltransferase regulatory subunit [Candidatus Woesearchaeota archaeon]MBW3017828.1 aspartate carbamoyltransferase regulatory subunit [Candidatus Woesearchaeota archaeon]
MSLEKKEIKIPPIKEGIAIDHIPKNQALKVAQILNLGNEEGMVTLGMNLMSSKMKSKDVLKIEGRDLTDDELNKISIVAPEATVSFIKDYKVEEKINVQLPKKVEKIVKCNNPRCITRHQDVSTLFHVIGKNPLKLKCHYCEKIILKEEIELI